MGGGMEEEHRGGEKNLLREGGGGLEAREGREREVGFLFRLKGYTVVYKNMKKEEKITEGLS